MQIHGSELMYNEVMWQYQDMARGGDGGYLGFERDGETTCRGVNYKGYPDSFSQKVCKGMGWPQLSGDKEYIYDNLEGDVIDPYSADPM